MQKKICGYGVDFILFTLNIRMEKKGDLITFNWSTDSEQKRVAHERGQRIMAKLNHFLNRAK